MTASENVPTVALQDVHFLFLDMKQDVITEWNQAFQKHMSQRLRSQTKILHGELENLAGDDNIYDCIVSPANSYGRLDGSFDDYLSKALMPPDDYFAPTHHVQSVLYRRHRGFVSPGTCTLVSIAGTNFDAKINKHKCNFIALCPTMHYPDDVRWDKEVVYECTWALLCEIDNHNANCTADKKIKKVLCPGFATGIGKVSAKKCAEQMALAFKHYETAVSEPHKWSALSWDDTEPSCEEVIKTYKL